MLVLIVGGAVLLLFALLSLSQPSAVLGRKRRQDTLVGALVVGALVFVLLRAGSPWLAAALAVLWSAARRYSSNDQRGPSSARPSPDGERSSDGARRPATSLTTSMTRDEAYDVLGLTPGAPRDEIVVAYRRLMKKVHPDQGGTTYLAARLNQAKAVLLD